MMAELLASTIATTREKPLQHSPLLKSVTAKEIKPLPTILTNHRRVKFVKSHQEKLIVSFSHVFSCPLLYSPRNTVVPFAAEPRRIRVVQGESLSQRRTCDPGTFFYPLATIHTSSYTNLLNRLFALETPPVPNAITKIPKVSPRKKAIKGLHFIAMRSNTWKISPLSSFSPAHNELMIFGMTIGPFAASWI
ncbi:hypothetical protein O181_110577 [Austropuccinia psidii MF-1]|uniref:Uncharacterized protein n=1 Tax=Austropuccinia psidii MF-1 TaxID=1389203 RepID=A0A9Q3PSI4_9BASI|nr:hypothetical protein [Austropuccinia psidii MF-1]